MQETWKVISDFPSYEVSDLGRVRRCLEAPVKCRGFAWVGKVLSAHPYTNGYLHVVLSKDKKYHSKTIHALVAEAFIGPRPSKKHVVAHNDGSRTNNVVSNLRYATYSENCADKIIHGTHLSGERANGAKLTNEQAQCIRQMHGFSSDIAKQFGVSRITVSRIRNNQSYKSL